MSQKPAERRIPPAKAARMRRQSVELLLSGAIGSVVAYLSAGPWAAAAIAAIAPIFILWAWLQARARPSPGDPDASEE